MRYLTPFIMLAVLSGLASAQTTIFSDDMTNFPTGWTLSPTAGWTKSSTRYYSASYSARCDDVSSYANSQNNYMTRSVSLSGYTSASLSFYIWQYTESGYDYVYLQYYSGSTWTTAWSRAGSYQSWAQQTVNIPVTATQVRFWFKSDASVVYEGAYIDNVVLTATGAATPTLAVSMTSWAPAATGGTSSAVNVTNSGTTSVIAYTVASNQSWLTVSASSGNTPGSFTMTAAANTTTSSRTATVTVTATTSGVSGSPKTITVTQAAGTATQNDAGSGGDAGNTFATALSVSPGSWTGCYLSSTDTTDYYKFSVTSGQVIKVKITPPSGVDFDLKLYNPSQVQKASSTAGAGVADSCVFTADATGYWYAKAYYYSGSGNYGLQISVSGTVTPTLAVSMSSWSVAAAGGTSSAVNVTNSGSTSVIAYTVSSNQSWLTVSSASGNTPGSFTMTASANTSTSSRTATVTVTATTSGVSGSPKTITVTQAAAANPMKYICLKVGQGDAAVLVSPTGKYALIDGGPNNTYGLAIWKFLRDSLRTHHLDYIFTSHYHSDHIGGTDLVIDSLCAYGIDSIIVGAYDRGGSYGTGTDYTNYVSRTGSKRRTASLGQTFDLGGGLTVQVVSMNGKTISGDSVVIPTDEENGKSMGLLISYNGFKLISAGDIAGYNTGDYKNVESILAPDIGPVNVLHVNHHSSASSSNPAWISTLDPQASLISLGDGNSYGYPKQETLDRLCADPGLDNHIYQTEAGTGGTIPSGRGHVCNSNIWVVVNSTNYTVWGESYSIAKDGGALATEPRFDDGLSDGSLRALVHPNPVSGGRTTISFSAPSEGIAAVEIYNILGQKVRTLAGGCLAAGRHDIVWDGSDDSGRRLAGGVYLLRLQFDAGDGLHQAGARILLLR